MTKLSSIFLFGILCSVGFASIKYEHISSWNYNTDSCDGCRKVNFTCGVTNKDREVLIQSWIKSYGTLNFTNCKFPEIESSFISAFTNTRTLYIPDVELEKLQKSTFWNITKLEKLFAHSNRLTEIPALLFINAAQLAYVDFSYNALKRIDPLAFENVKLLQTLNVSNNQLDRIDQNCLAIPSLLTLDLSKNNLSSLSGDMFEKTTALKYLNLSFNPIGNMQVGLFSQMTNLEYLSLRRTNISKIELGTFSYQHKLLSLDLSDNQITNFDFNLFLPAMHDLQSLYLSQNQLRHLNGFRNAIFPNLALLDIKNNQFNCSYLEYFFEFVNWDRLHLSVDPPSKQSHQTNIRGINCELSSETYTHFNEYSPLQKKQMQNEMNENLIKLNVKFSEELFFMKIILLLVFIVIATYGAMYLLINRDGIFRSNRSAVKSPSPVVKYSNADEFLIE